MKITSVAWRSFAIMILCSMSAHAASPPVYCTPANVNGNQNSMPLNWHIKGLKLTRLQVPYYSPANGYALMDVKNEFELFQGRLYNLMFNPNVISNSNVPLPQYYWCKVWVDFNSDGNFDEVGPEKVLSLFYQINQPIVIPFTVPANAVTANEIRMRIAVSDSEVGLACDDILSGLMIDYTMQIAPFAAGQSQDGYCLPLENLATSSIQTLAVDNTVLPTGPPASPFEEYDLASLKFVPGQTRNIYLFPANPAPGDKFFWSVSIDLNGDKTFDSNELLYHGQSNGNLTGLISIPSNAVPGKTRMRITMGKDSYNAFHNVPPPVVGCYYLEYGQVKDYLVSMQEVCLPPADLKVTFPKHYSALFEWSDAVPAPELYDLQFKEATASSWSSWYVKGNSFATDLIHAGIAYEARIRSVCVDTVSAFTEVSDFLTPGYCESKGNDSFDWIDFVALKNISNPSGPDGGYADFTSKEQTVLAVGEWYDLYFSAGGQVRPRNWKAWIDFNRDGDFDDWESIMKVTTSDLSTATETFQVPDYAALLEGVTRMRITTGFDSPDLKPCGSSYFGETEDYRIWLVRVKGEGGNVKGDESSDAFTIYPQPANEILYVEPVDRIEITDIKLFDSQGTELEIRCQRGDRWSVFTQGYREGIYILHVSTTTSVTRKLVNIGR
jgi:hypothetical protein